MSWGLLLSAWLVGTLGGVHCVSMCGGFVAAISARDSAGRTAGAPLLPARALVASALTYHAGRIGTYMALGAIFGAAGALAVQLAGVSAIQRALYLVANVLLLLVGVALLSRGVGVMPLQRAGARAFSAILPALQPLLRSRGPTGRVALGLAWGLMPCGLIYSVLPLALFAGGPGQGALVMLAFGLGTLPSLVAAGALLARCRTSVRSRAFRIGAAAMVVAFALVGVYRVAFAPETLSLGAFCLTL
ncbi:MAG TPA: sulfite exporter TauE/SafE family protein [Casimicrobiaceae bacterium]